MKKPVRTPKAKKPVAKAKSVKPVKKSESKRSAKELIRKEYKRARKERRRIRKLLEQETDLALKETNKQELEDLFVNSSKEARKNFLKFGLRTFGIVNGVQQANSVLRNKLNMENAQIEQGIIELFGDYAIKLGILKHVLKQYKLPRSVINILLEHYIISRLIPNRDNSKIDFSKRKIENLLSEIHVGNVSNQKILERLHKQKPIGPS